MGENKFLNVVKYTVDENNIRSGFLKHNFIVYEMIAVSKTTRFNKQDTLQKIYVQCKEVIDYETERYLNVKSVSIEANNDTEGDAFILEAPKAKTLEITLDSEVVVFELSQSEASVQISSVVKDQYNEVFVVPVDLSTTYGEIIYNTPTVPRVAVEKK